MNIRIQTQDELSRVRNLNSWLRRPSVRRLELDIASLDTKQKERFEKRVKDLFNDCGCLWAAPVFLLSFLLIFALHYGQSNFADLSAVNVDQFEQARLFGTSLRGAWSIDISSVLGQLEIFDQANPNYNGRDPANPCTATEAFWQHFRGIELKIFWVSH